MNESIKTEAIAFIRVIASRCSNCLRRTTENCQSCPSARAKRIIALIERDEKNTNPVVDYSLYSRMKIVRDRLQKAGRPLLASEIDLSGLCTYQLKLWTLKRMIRMGVLRRKVAMRKPNSKYRLYRYYLTPTKETDK